MCKTLPQMLAAACICVLVASKPSLAILHSWCWCTYLSC